MSVVTAGLHLAASVGGYYGLFCLFRSQAARGNEGKDGLSEMGTRLDPVPGLPGGGFYFPEDLICVFVIVQVFFK